jgi:hypothetical protein
MAMKQALLSNNTQLVAELKHPKSDEQLKANLSTVVAQVQRARVNGVKPDLTKVSSLTNAVAQVVKSEPQIPEAWQAAVQLVNYRTASLSAAPSAEYACSKANVVVTGGPSPATMIATASFYNCVLDLDEPTIWTKPDLESQGQSITDWHLDLHNVTVHYTGGASLANVREITFDRCIMEFEINSRPSSPLGQSMLTQLLAAPTPGTSDVILAPLTT